MRPKVLDFLSERPQNVRVDGKASKTVTLSTGSPHGCVLSPLLFTLLTIDCVPSYSANHIIKFAGDTTVVDLITNNNGANYRSEVSRLVQWCNNNDLFLEVGKTKEIATDFRRGPPQYPPRTVNGATVERVNSTKFLGVHISEDLS
ncbi:hypothetical protein QTP70_012835 [Hemibagrus guttatus]|uniref:Reverse transcriptase domain-containing protein n=1 Tax=Hemibagrus guttatus TaxID=175788 RepID=A0AAE0Q7N7_9TELE|nr:hypothetical protein QTP70_012835 [Hemibagrus guttatus]KAK3540747.1 hypothetical protein QTP86_001358 [Hemibagrus guttatus]